MKELRVISTMLLMLLSYNSNAQTSGIEYYYDNAGNRVQREFVTMGGSGMMLADSIVSHKTDYDFTLFPNTVENNLFVHAEHKFLELESRELHVYDMDGKLIEKRAFNSIKERIDLSKCATGSYLVKVTASGGYSADWRIVKM